MGIVQLFFLSSILCVLIKLFQKLIKLHQSPLLKIPGPYACKITSGLSLYYIANGQVHKWMHKLHLKYGPVVQFSPTEVSVISQEGVEAIYNSYQFKKTPFYKALEFGGRNISSIVERDSHSARKKILTKIFSKKNFVNFETMFDEVAVQALITKLDEYALSNREFDIYKLSINCFFNFIGMFTLSEELNLVSDGSHPITKWLKDSQFYGILSHAVPLIRFTGNWLGKDGYHALQQFCHKRIEHRQQNPEIKRNDVLQLFLDHNKSDPQNALSDAEITGEITIQFLAGIEAPGTTLAWLIKLLVKHPHVMNLLQKELDNAFPSRDKKVTSDIINAQCPYLDAVLCEAFRYYPVVGGFIPRLVPKSGYSFSGLFLPADVEVGFSGFAYHRSPLLWKDPDQFNPDRFLGDHNKHNKSQLMTFIKGPNSCLGREIGLMSLHLTIATLFRRYNLSMDLAKLNFRSSQYLALKSSDNQLLVSIYHRA